jgi:hypothetical protein
LAAGAAGISLGFSAGAAGLPTGLSADAAGMSLADCAASSTIVRDGGLTPMTTTATTAAAASGTHQRQAR